MFDWTAISNDPNNKEASARMREFLVGIREVLDKKLDRDGIILDMCRDRSVLDIGICEHTMKYIEDSEWLHKKIRSVAGHVLGVDINNELCTYLESVGYNVRCVDATSDTDLGERFDMAMLGDVLEHVGDLEGILLFAKRHLNPGGRLIVTTPNPMARSRVKRMRKASVYIGNSEHTCWLAPTNMNELARRTGLTFEKYIVQNSGKYIWLNKLFGRKHDNDCEFRANEYIYVLGRNE